MSTQEKTRILIVGAGIAGLTLSFWLKKFGFKVDHIEKSADHKHRQGYMVDFWGPGYDVAEKMDILPQLKKQDHHLNHFIFLSDHDKISSYFNVAQIRQLLDERHLTFQHGDLETILLEKAISQTPIQYSTKISKIENTDKKASVVFDNKIEKTYDLVIGADGVHSQIRHIIFGDEKEFSHDLGYELAAFMQDNTLKIENDFITYADPDKQVSICPTRDNQLASYYVYRSEQVVKENRLNTLKEQFKQSNWETAKLLDGLTNARSSLYDRLIQIKMRDWHKNRVVLVGDACQCMTLFAGQGASLAMAGAYTLATLLKENSDNFSFALEKYQQKMQPHVAAKQTLAEQFLLDYVPTDASNISRRNYFTRQFFKKMYQVGF